MAGSYEMPAELIIFHTFTLRKVVTTLCLGADLTCLPCSAPQSPQCGLNRVAGKSAIRTDLSQFVDFVLSSDLVCMYVVYA